MAPREFPAASRRFAALGGTAARRPARSRAAEWTQASTKSNCSAGIAARIHVTVTGTVAKLGPAWDQGPIARAYFPLNVGADVRGAVASAQSDALRELADKKLCLRNKVRANNDKRLAV